MRLVPPQRSPNDLNFLIRGIPVRVTMQFWLTQAMTGAILAVFPLAVSSPYPILVRLGVALLVFGFWVLCAFGSVLVHELGHVLVGKWFGAHGEIVFTAFGGLALGSAELPKRWQRVAVYLAGPFAQFLLAATIFAALWFIGPSLSRGNGPRAMLLVQLILLVVINVGWPVLNLLPIPPFDGSQILREVLSWYRQEQPPPWHQHADWWRGGAAPHDWRPAVEGARPKLLSLLFPGLLAAAIVGFVAWWAWDANRYNLPQKAFASLQGLGDVSGWDSKDSLYGVSFEGRRVGDRELALLGEFNADRFQVLNLCRTPVGDADLHHVIKLTGLRALYLQETQVTDEGLAQLTALQRLQVLDLSHTQVTDAGLAHLQVLPRLGRLSLARTRVTDAGIVHLKSLRMLQVLHIEGTRVSADGIANLLKALPTLQVNPEEE